MIDDARWRAFNDKQEAIAREAQRLSSTWVQANSPQADALVDKIKTPLTREYNLMDLLKRPELDYTDIAALFPSVSSPSENSQPESENVSSLSSALAAQVAEQVEITEDDFAFRQGKNARKED